MSVYDNFADTPNQIKTEGQEITLTFQRTGDFTARISWNIPPPAQGCSTLNQAYDGIVLTISNAPANYLTTSPKDGTYYDGDPTGDADLHAGSTLDIAKVLAALYHNKTTTFIDIDGIQPKTAYYVSGYAVDGVGRYHREGVHAYSIPTGTQSYVTEDYPAKHDIMLYSVNPIAPKDLTGLVQNTSYVLPIKVECVKYDITVNGSDAMTYANLVSALNYQFSLVAKPYYAPTAPHAGSYYKEGESFFVWNGSRLTPVVVLSSTHSPSTPTIGAYWLNTGTNVLSVYTIVGWLAITQIIASAEPPTELESYDIWFDGVTVRVWENGHWCDYTTIISATNPQLPPNLSVGDYWYKPSDSELFKWNDILQKWDDALVIYYDTDPNSFTAGDFWYDEKNLKVKQYVSGLTWTVVSGVLYSESNEQGEYQGITVPVANTYWFDTRLEKFYKRNLLNTEWIEQEFVSFPTNPKNRKSCDLWWNSSPSVNDLFVWEAFTSTWIPVNAFYRQETDPTTPPLLDEHTAWVAPDGKIYLITPQTCASVNYINSAIDPREIEDGTIWKNASSVYYVYLDGEWVILDAIMYYPTNPYTLVNGMLWYDMINVTLYRYDINGETEETTWVEQCLFTDKSFIPKIGEQWFDTVNEILLEWNGSSWIPSKPFIYVQFVQRKCLDEYDTLSFSTNKTGCHEKFEIMSESNTLFEGLTTSVIYTDPIDGSSGVDAGPMFLQLGVGTDGSPDERRRLHDEIRMTFGYPSTRVELTKAQLDQCVDNALLMLRKHSSYSYQKAMFFLDLKPNQQVYKLTNRCVGFNKIVDILALHRMRAGAFKAAYAGNETFAYAAIQQLYSLGTFDLLTFHLTASYVEELETMFANRIMYQWLERKRELKLYQLPRGHERILVEAILERTEQDLISDRETAYWLKRWAIVEAKGMLAQIRGKFATLPGPNGSTQLNASDLQTQLEQERTTLIEEIQSKAMQDLIGIGLKAHLVMG